MSLCLNPSCQQINVKTDRFCQKCGEELLLLQRYRSEFKIGEGGFGKTYRAVDEALPSKPLCVIKQFIYAGSGLAKATELFEQEAVQLDQLGKHNQIPALYAHCQQKGQQFLVQEYIDGENLAQELSSQGFFDEVKIRQLLLELLPVLEFIHQNQVIHRDIKPENIIRRRTDNKLVLVDFGAAKQATLTAMQKTGTVIGSAEYTAPEQTRGKAIFASDLYSLGATCLQLLTGLSPFDLKNNDDAWVWRDFLHERMISKDLGEIIDKSIAKVSIRYISAAEMLAVVTPTLPTKPSKYSAPPQVSSVAKPTSQFLTSTLSARGTVSAGFFGLSSQDVAVDIKMVSILGGSFQMGSNKNKCENPIHTVNIKPFKIGKYQVTQKQYRAVMGTNPSNFKGDNRPVENVCWYQAKEFCTRLSKVLGQEVRLPSEAEWEYACRAGSTGKYCFGDRENEIEDFVLTVWSILTLGDGEHELGGYAWYNRRNSKRETHRVRQKRPNNWGLYDMHGNVWEWCEDVWHENYNGAPTDGSFWNSWGDQDRKVIRGGSWDDDANNCRSASRNWGNSRCKFNSVSFRVVLSSS